MNKPVDYKYEAEMWKARAAFWKVIAMSLLVISLAMALSFKLVLK